MSAPKLPLLVRKDIKDNFEGKKDQLAEKFKALFGEDYKFEVDFPALYAQGDTGYQQDSLGKLVYEAIEGGSRRISDDTKKGQDKDLVEGFNDAVSKRTITVVADADFKGSYCGCRVNDGVFEIVFKPKGLGTNSYSACEYWKKAINEAAAKSNPKGLPPTAKQGIKKDFEEKKADLEGKMSKQLGGETLTINADFADIWGKLIDAHDALPEHKKKDLDLDNLARNLGSFTRQYFEALLDKLERELKHDELMIEGFLEEVSTKEAWFGLVAESESLKKSYGDTSIADGKIWFKSKPTKFGVNVFESYDGFSKLL